MSEPARGRFCWHDLMTTDPEASGTFFTELFGWTVGEIEMEDIGTYRMLSRGGEGFGGMVQLEEGCDVPPHWIGYVTVDDVDAAAQRAEGHGGTIAVPGTDIPNVGRFAVVGDNSGGFTSPFKSVHRLEDPQGPPSVGAFCWNELLATDLEACRSFYSEVYGWGHREMDMGPMGTYTVFVRGEKDAAGMMKKPEDAPGPSSWLHYVLVEDVDASAAKVTELGGKVCVEPTDIPDIGRFAVASDPTGAMFGIFK